MRSDRANAMAKLQTALKAHGGLAKLPEIFAKMDADSSGALDREEFQVGLETQLGVRLTAEEFMLVRCAGV